MWIRRRPRGVEHDLRDAADNLRDAVRKLLDISGELVRTGNVNALKTLTSVIVALQDDEEVLREHASTLNTTTGGRRSTDKPAGIAAKN